MKFVFAKIIIVAILFCCVGITSAEDIQVVSSLTDLEYIVNSTWVSNSINRLMPPAKDCMYENHLGAVAYANDFDTNFIASLIPVVLYNDTNEFVIYPVEVIETNNISGRVRNYYSAISTNPVVLYSNEVLIANYPVSWIENIYGEPPEYLSGSAIQDWYDACDPMRQHVLCDLLPSNSVPDYLTMLTNSVGYYVEGTNTNSVLVLYSNCIAVVQCSINAEDAELYLHAPDDISMLDVYNSTNLLSQYGWNLVATLEHILDPLRYVAGFDASSMYYSLGNGVLDSDGDGLLDARELMLFGTNPELIDSDYDGLSDGEEVLYYRLNPLNSDTDGDGLDDGWEVQYGLNPYDSTVNDADADPDHDGLSNSEEYLLGTDPCNPDTDGDGRSDGAEDSFGTNPCKFDTDGDGLSDGYEDNRKIITWGNNDYGQCNVPTNLPDIISVKCGGHHTLALKFDGTVVAWGQNTLGQTNVPSNLTDVIAISAGYYHSVALKNDGTVVAWGHNGNSQCDVPNGLTNITAIACGNYHTLALKSNGTVVAWGLNSNSQTNVPYLHSVITIAAGSSHSLAIWKPGTFSYFKGWGWNNYDQCTLPSSWVCTEKAIDGGNAHSVALTALGKVIAWGNNTFGQCNVPASLSSGVTAISTKFNHTLALKSDGTVAAWGQNTDGQCNVPAGLSDVTAISAGTKHNATLEPSKLNSLSVDTDGDLLPDGWEVNYGLDPLVENNIHTDGDDDDLDLFDEYRYVTDPFSSDTDGDGVSDGDEVPHGGEGSNPNDADDYGDPTNCVTMLLTVGDPSGSHSERWNFNVFDGDSPVIRHVDDGFGTPGSNEYALVKGKEYKYEITWIDHNQEIFDYDWQALINGLTVSGFYEGLYNTGGFIVEDPENLLTEFENGSVNNLAEGKEGKIIVPKVDLDGDFDHDGGVADDPDDPEEHTAPGLLVPLNDNDNNANGTADKDDPAVSGETDLVKVHLELLPDSIDSGLVILSALHKAGAGDIKVWENPSKGGTPVINTATTGSEWKKEWTLSSSFAEDLYVEGVNASSGDQITLMLEYQNSVGTTLCEDRILITVIVPELDVGETARPANSMGWDDPMVDEPNCLLVWHDNEEDEIKFDLLKYPDVNAVYYRITERSIWNNGSLPLDSTLIVNADMKNYNIATDSENYEFRVWYGPTASEVDENGAYQIYGVSGEDYDDAKAKFTVIYIPALFELADNLFYYTRHGAWRGNNWDPTSVSGSATMSAESRTADDPGTTHNFGATYIVRPFEVIDGRRYPRANVSMPIWYWDATEDSNDLLRESGEFESEIEEFINGISYVNLDTAYSAVGGGDTRIVMFDISPTRPLHIAYGPGATDLTICLGDADVIALPTCPYSGSGQVTLEVTKDASGVFSIAANPSVDVTVDDVWDFNFFNTTWFIPSFSEGPQDAATLQCGYGQPGADSGVGQVGLVRIEVEGSVDVDPFTKTQ